MWFSIDIAGYGNYWVAIMVMMGGFYLTMASGNLIKKLMGLAIFQLAVLVFYISVGKMDGGRAPILTGAPETLYSNPLPHVLMLTAIVVGVATLAVGLALAVRIKESYGSLEESALAERDRDKKQEED